MIAQSTVTETERKTHRSERWKHQAGSLFAGFHVLLLLNKLPKGMSSEAIILSYDASQSFCGRMTVRGEHRHFVPLDHVPRQ